MRLMDGWLTGFDSRIYRALHRREPRIEGRPRHCVGSELGLHLFRRGAPWYVILLPTPNSGIGIVY